jgi:hypothetical protein
VARRVADALGDGAPLSSVEGFVRQVIGWREYVWGWYWRRPWRDANALDATAPVPAALMGAPTRMRCVQVAMEGIDQRGSGDTVAEVAEPFGCLQPLLPMAALQRDGLFFSEWQAGKEVVQCFAVRRCQAVGDFHKEGESL